MITADIDAITKKYNEVAEYATNTDSITPIAVKIDDLNTEFEKIVADYRAFISQHVGVPVVLSLCCHDNVVAMTTPPLTDEGFRGQPAEQDQGAE